MLDVIFVAMFGIVAVMYFSVYLVRVRRLVRIHRAIQISTALVLAVAIVAFEVDVRFFTDWRKLAEPSPFFQSGMATLCLWIHLMFAVPTPFVWGWTIFKALKNFPASLVGPDMKAHAAAHRLNGWLSVGLMTATVVTGSAFYWMAFVAV